MDDQGLSFAFPTIGNFESWVTKSPWKIKEGLSLSIPLPNRFLWTDWSIIDVLTFCAKEEVDTFLPSLEGTLKSLNIGWDNRRGRKMRRIVNDLMINFICEILFMK